jgi:hypothetical protein
MAKTTGELLRLLVELESDQVERKQSVRNVKDKIRTESHPAPCWSEP